MKRMEIKIEETEDTLKIIKSCRQELKWAFIIGIICNICLIYPLLKETPGELYFGFALFYTPIFLLIQCLFCYRFSYELILIKKRILLRFYSQKNSLDYINFFINIIWQIIFNFYIFLPIL